MMSESDFWLRLQYRVANEFEGLRENHLRFRWCDGFVPEKYELNSPLPRITGRACIVNGQHSWKKWEFTLQLRGPVASQSEINWESLLPPGDVTRWMSVDLDRKQIE